MWRKLEDNEKKNIFRKLKLMASTFNFIYYIFMILLIFMTMLALIKKDINALITSVFGLGGFAFAFKMVSKYYYAEIITLSDIIDTLKICKTRIIKINNFNDGSSKKIATVKLYLQDEWKDKEIITGYNLKEFDEVYVISNDPHGIYFEIYTVKDIEKKN